MLMVYHTGVKGVSLRAVVVLALLGGALFATIVFLPSRDQYGLRKKMAFENNDSYIRTQVITCLKTGEPTWRGRCYRELGTLLSSQFTLPETLSALSIIDDEEGIKQQCHALVHYLGQNEYKREGDLSGTFRSCLSSPVACGEGCFHGAVEGYVAERGGTLEKKNIAAVCDREFTENQVTYDSCVHGLGHAFMLQFDGDILPSLDSCRALDSASDRSFCYSGVFMENVFSFWSPDHSSKYIRPEDPFYPCTIVDKEYQSSCYSSQASFVINMSLRPGDYMPAYRNAMRYCAAVPIAAQAECYGSLGSSMVVSSSDPKEIANVCGLVPAGEARSYCFKEALVFIGHGSGGNEERIKELCEYIPDLEDASTCRASAERTVESWKPFLN